MTALFRKADFTLEKQMRELQKSASRDDRIRKQKETARMTELLKKLFTALGIETDPQGLTEDEAVAMIMEKLGGANERLAAEAVDDALRAHKIRDDEREWALDFAKDSLEAFKMFAEKRGVQLTSLLASSRRPSKTGPLSDLQRKINEQVGISDDLFLKYNEDPKVPLVKVDQIQVEMNRPARSQPGNVSQV